MPLLLALASVTPAPSATPATLAPLHEIMRVRSSALCAEFASHANGAIDATTTNDSTLLGLIDSLGTTAMDDNVIAYNREIVTLQNLANNITRQWSIGEREVGQVRALAAKSTNPQEKLELMASANALGGALWRQRRIARDLGGFVAFLEANQMLSSNTGGERAASAMVDPRGPYFIPGITAPPPDPLPFPGAADDPSPDAQAMAAAKDFQGRLGAIGQDEIQSAVHIEQASEGC
ncbi:MAG: hypothetical protein ACYDGM_00095 [Vulcanimicrobiaceae bacterium]